MEMLKSKTMILFIVMVLGASYIGGMENSNLKDDHNIEQTILVNA